MEKTFVVWQCFFFLYQNLKNLFLRKANSSPDYSDRTFLLIKNIYKSKTVIIIKYCSMDR